MKEQFYGFGVMEKIAELSDIYKNRLGIPDTVKNSLLIEGAPNVQRLNVFNQYFTESSDKDSGLIVGQIIWTRETLKTLIQKERRVVRIDQYGIALGKNSSGQYLWHGTLPHYIQTVSFSPVIHPLLYVPHQSRKSLSRAPFVRRFTRIKVPEVNENSKDFQKEEITKGIHSLLLNR